MIENSYSDNFFVMVMKKWGYLYKRKKFGGISCALLETFLKNFHFFLPGLMTDIPRTTKDLNLNLFNFKKATQHYSIIVLYSAYSYALLSKFTSRSGIESPHRLIQLICAFSSSQEVCGNFQKFLSSQTYNLPSFNTCKLETYKLDWSSLSGFFSCNVNEKYKLQNYWNINWNTVESPVSDKPKCQGLGSLTTA